MVACLLLSELVSCARPPFCVQRFILAERWFLVKTFLWLLFSGWGSDRIGLQKFAEVNRGEAMRADGIAEVKGNEGTYQKTK